MTAVTYTPALVPDETPMTIRAGRNPADTVFQGVLAASGVIVVLLLGATIAYLGVKSWSALHVSGFHFITSDRWQPPASFGILGDLVGSLMIALVALVIGVPVSVACALLINEYAPRRVRNLLISVVDLLATVPSIVYGFWGLEALSQYVFGTTKWLAHFMAFVPLFRSVEPDTYGNSVFLCGLIVGVMVVPIVTSISREVLAQAPRDACEAALALGGTKWGMVTDVLLPFARNGIIGASLLGLGRAMGETMAVLLILSSNNIVTPAILGPNGLGSIPALIGLNFTSSADITKSALILAALTLFATVLVVNVVARTIVNRSTANA
ncbi:MAG: phosphate ABC transporter permease subunit PstC [Acidimicrobiales bacterium]